MWENISTPQNSASLARITQRLLIILVAFYLGSRLFWAGNASIENLVGTGLLLLGAAWNWRARQVDGTSNGAIWRAMLGGCLLWAAAGLYSALAPQLALPAAAQMTMLLSVAALCCWTVAVVSVHRQTRVLWQLAPFTDAFLMLASGLTVISYFIVGPLIIAARQDTALLLVLCAAVMLLFSGLTFLRYTAASPLIEAHALAVSGVLTAVFGQATYLWMLAAGFSTDSTLLGASRILAALLFFTAAESAIHPPRRDKPVKRWEDVAPWMPLIYIGVVVLLLVVSSRDPQMRQIAAVGVIISLLLAVFRLGLSMVENRSLRLERDDLRLQTEEWTRLAISDPLTGLFNKGYFEYRLKTEWARSQRHAAPLSVVALDLDNFKSVNDRRGHAAGDRLLAEIGAAIKSTCRTVDIACRCGGDEFVVILPHTRVDDATILADRLRVAVGKVLAGQRLSESVGVSAGVAGYPETALTSDDLMLQSDKALYQAKALGKGQTVIWDSSSLPFVISPTDTGPLRVKLPTFLQAKQDDTSPFPILH